MTNTRKWLTGLLLATIVLLLVGWLSMPIRSEAQNQGKNAVWGSGSTPSASAAFIDASAFANVNDDICVTLYNIISPSSYPSSGAVIDARGIDHTNSHSDGNGNMLCAESPWLHSGSPTNHPATILLPAGYSTPGSGGIIISQTWILPNGSKIIGEGPNPNASAILQAASSFTAGSAMIEMGSSSSTVCPLDSNNVPVCTGISVEHMTLDGSSLAIHGIDDSYAQDRSYVRDVALKDFGGTGLSVSAPNSGPFTDMYYAAKVESSCDGSICPVCAVLQAQTLGIHGITCIGATSVSKGQTNQGAGIYVNASNNSVEDAHSEVFADAVRIGDIASGAVGNVVVSNVSSAISGTQQGNIASVVHICGARSNGNFLTCNNHTNGGATVSDITILQAADQNGNVFVPPTAVSAVIIDDVSGTSITPGMNSGAPAALYVLGEQEPVGVNNQYSRFASSPSTSGNNLSTVVPTWTVGGNIGANQTCSLPGALYSNSIGGSGSSVYVCSWTSGGSLQWRNLI